MKISTTDARCVLYIAGFFIVGFCVTGCGGPASPPTDTDGTTDTTDTTGAAEQSLGGNNTAPAPKDEDPKLPKADVIVGSWTDIEAKVAQQKGKIVVLDLWSSTCEPCLRELPGLEDLKNKFPKSVVCLSVNLDYIGAEGETPETHRETVEGILERMNLTFLTFISSTTDFEVYDKIRLASIPAVLIYDQQGALAKRFDNDQNEFGDEGFTYADHIVPFVERAMEAPPIDK